MARRVDFYHAPLSRSGGTLMLLQELGAEYDLHLLDMKAGEQRRSAYLAINPMGKVPAIRHEGTLITEQIAIFIYLGDLYAETGLAPQMGDPLRGSYLRWLAFYAGCFEPALLDKALNREAPPPSAAGYGDYDTMMNTLTGQLSIGPWFLGERFTVADVLWGNALHWILAFNLIPAHPPITRYVERFNARPLVEQCRQQDADFAAKQEAARAAKAGS
ncbi:MAG TPA: glutathione S-transferase family protein [Dongiaceae bacterium]|nr:glutathione S-transferase family protein [Dongiaceae bacterium]